MNAVHKVERLVGRVRRRLFFQILVVHLLWCVAAAIAVAAVWLFFKQLFIPAANGFIVWSPFAGIVLCGVLGAVAFSFVRRPTRIDTALSVDDRFAFRERITTLLSLSEVELQTPAGAALLADVNQRIDKLDFAGKFPLRVGWLACLAPLGACILAVLAFVSKPSWTWGEQDSPSKNRQVVLSNDTQTKLETLKAIPLQKRELDPENAEKLKELEDAWKRLIDKPRPKTDEEVRERIRDIRKIEEQLKERARQMQQDADKDSELKAALKKLGDLDPKEKKLSEGPIREFEEALSEGKLDKAEDIIERLQKKLKNNELDQKQQQDLAKQLAALEQKLKQLMDPRDMEHMKELEELAKLLGECKNCLAQEQDQQISAEKLRNLVKNLKDMKKLELSKEQMKDMKKAEGDLAEAREALLLALNRSNGMGGSGPPGGRRPVGEEPKNSKIKDERQTGQLDPNGQLQVSGFSRGGSFSKIPAREVGGVFKQAVQDAPEAIERQYIPLDVTPFAKGYFQKLAGE